MYGVRSVFDRCLIGVFQIFSNIGQNMKKRKKNSEGSWEGGGRDPSPPKNFLKGGSLQAIIDRDR